MFGNTPAVPLSQHASAARVSALGEAIYDGAVDEDPLSDLSSDDSPTSPTVTKTAVVPGQHGTGSENTAASSSTRLEQEQAVGTGPSYEGLQEALAEMSNAVGGASRSEAEGGAKSVGSEDGVCGLPCVAGLPVDTSPCRQAVDGPETVQAQEDRMEIETAAASATISQKHEQAPYLDRLPEEPREKIADAGSAVRDAIDPSGAECLRCEELAEEVCGLPSYAGLPAITSPCLRAGGESDSSKTHDDVAGAEPVLSPTSEVEMIGVIHDTIAQVATRYAGGAVSPGDGEALRTPSPTSVPTSVADLGSPASEFLKPPRPEGAPAPLSPQPEPGEPEADFTGPDKEDPQARMCVFILFGTDGTGRPPPTSAVKIAEAYARGQLDLALMAPSEYMEMIPHTSCR